MAKLREAALCAVLLLCAALLVLLAWPTPSQLSGVQQQQQPLRMTAATDADAAADAAADADAAAAAASDDAPCASHLHVFVDHAASVELSFILGVVLKDTRAACGVCVRLQPRAAFAAALADAAACQPLLLLANTDLLEAEVEAMRQHPAAARARALVFHLSDEHEDRAIPAGGYDLPRLLLRSYYAEGADRLADLTYLQEGAAGGPVALGNDSAGTAPGAPPARRLWVPLGHTDAFAAALAPQLRARTRERPLAWSWAGSRDGKWARDYFLRGLEDSPHRQAVLDAGRLHVFAKFMEPGAALAPLAYTALLLDSRLAPCPNGGSAEQFRVWEALAAGAVPLLPSGVRPHHLAYVRALGLRALWVDQGRWHLDAAPLLLAASRNASFVGALEAMQGHNARALRGVYGRLAARVAAEVCAAAGLACSGGGGGGGQCPRTAEGAAPRCQAVG